MLIIVYIITFYLSKCFNLKRQKKRFSEQTPVKELFAEAGSSPCSDTVKRRSSDSVSWSKCMFCQRFEGKQTILHNVQTLEKSSDISSGHSWMMLSGRHDLIASEGKYHLKSLVQFQRNTTNTDKKRR